MSIKKIYNKPILKKVGTLHEITLGGPGSFGDGNSETPGGNYGGGEGGGQYSHG
jgi:hypothetical protein